MPESDTPESEFDLAQHFPESQTSPPDWTKETPSDFLLLRGLLKLLAERGDSLRA
jgi:hypothetical protein